MRPMRSTRSFGGWCSCRVLPHGVGPQLVHAPSFGLLLLALFAPMGAARGSYFTDGQALSGVISSCSGREWMRLALRGKLATCIRSPLEPIVMKGGAFGYNDRVILQLGVNVDSSTRHSHAVGEPAMATSTPSQEQLLNSFPPKLGLPPPP